MIRHSGHQVGRQIRHPDRCQSDLSPSHSLASGLNTDAPSLLRCGSDETGRIHLKPIEIFKSGTHNADNGKSFTFSDADLKASAAAYDPKLHEAPLVVGHPSHDDPAYGWVSGLSSDGGSIIATPDQVNPEFSEMVEAGSFKNVSASFYAPNAKANPAPGTYYLRHVGFLGAKAPSIKGLKSIEFAEFADGDDDIITIQFAEVSDFTLSWALRSVGRIFQRLRDRLLVEEGLEAADDAVNVHDLNAIIDAASKAERAGEEVREKAETTASFSEPTDEAAMSDAMTDDDKKKFKDDTAALADGQKKLDEERVAFAEEQDASRRESDKLFLGGLADEGKVAPGALDGLINFMAELDADEVVNFGEADEDKMTPHAFFRSMLEKSGEVVNFSEASKDDGKDHDKADANAIASDAIAFQETERAAGRTVSTAAAVAKVIAKK